MEEVPTEQPVAPAEPAAAPLRAPRQQTDGFEDLLGGRVLAWVGGVAVLLGIAFLFAIAVSSGWIGEGARTALGAFVSTVLLGAGIWLHEHKGRTDAALAALAAGVSGLFVTITVAAQVYELVPSLMGTVLAVAVGALATALAVRWESRGIAGLGILGALAAPVLVGTDFDGGTVAILFVALAAAAGVLLWQRWNWLALAAFAISTPQWLIYLFDGAASISVFATLLAFGGLGVVVAVGHDLRVRADGLQLQSAFLLALNAIVVAGAGWFALESLGEPGPGRLWLAGLAAAHVAVGLVGPRLARVSSDIGLLSLVLGVVLADVAFALVADGPVLAIGWACGGVAFAALLKRTRPGTHDEELVVGGLGSHVALALVVTLTVDDPLSVVAGGGMLSGASAASVAALAAGCLVSARLASERSVTWRVLLDVLGLSALVCLTALALDGTELVLAWTGEIALLVAIAYRRRDPVAGWSALGFLSLTCAHVLLVDAPVELLQTGIGDPLGQLVPIAAVGAAAIVSARVLPPLLDGSDPALMRVMLDTAGITLIAYLTAVALEGQLVTVAFAAEAVVLAAISRRFSDDVSGWAALPFLAFAGIHAVAYEAQPVSLVSGLTDPLSACVGIGAVVAATLLVSQRVTALHSQLGPALQAGAGLALLYLASGLVVTPFEGGNGVDSAVLSAHQQGQVVLSVFWALVGVATLAAGLLRDVRGLRLAALALLGATVVKVFMFDLATLTSVYRAVSFIGLGLLLLVGAFVWQRLRPKPLPDLREAPPALR